MCDILTKELLIYLIATLNISKFTTLTRKTLDADRNTEDRAFVVAVSRGVLSSIILSLKCMGFPLRQLTGPRVEAQTN